MFDASFIANPYPTYQRLLASGRLHQVNYLGGAWLVPHYDDVVALLRDPRLSADRSAAMVQQFPPEQRAPLHPLHQQLARSIVLKDGAEHRRLRRLLSTAFTPRAIEQLRPEVVRLTNALIDAALEQSPDGHIELLRQVAHPLPALVIAQLLGVPHADQPRLVRWSDALACFIGKAQPSFEDALRAQHGLLAMTDYFRAVVAEQRRHPTDTLIGLLLAAEEQDDPLSEEDLLAQCTSLLIAGHETTRNLIGNGLMTLLQHPVQHRLLERSPQLIRGAVEEMVRYESPVQASPRIVVEDFTLYGVALTKGEVVVLLNGAANRDPALFVGPDCFDITRRGARPLSFGHGPHACIGMALAYLEAEVAIAALLRRLPNLRLVSRTPHWADNFMLRGLSSLPLAFDPPRQQRKAA